MKVLHQSKHLIVKYDEVKSLFENSWFDSANMSEEEYKNELVKYADLVVAHRPKNFLVNSSDFAFAVSPNVQLWIAENIFSRTMHPDAEKMAIIVSSDVFAQVSIEQTVEEASELLGKLNTRYFDVVEDAMKWLKS